MGQRKLIKLKDGIKEMNCDEAYKQFENYIYKAAHGFRNTGESFDDLFQIGSVGLVKAFNGYKIESNVLFITYLATVVNNEMLMNLQKIKKRRNNMNISIDSYKIFNDKKSLTLLETLEDPVNYEQKVIDNIVFAEVKTLINRLTVNGGEKAINLFYFNNMTQEQISKELNFTQSYIAKLLKKSLKIVRDNYEL